MTDTPSIPSDGGTLEALIEKWRRDAAACDAFLTGEIPCPVWVVSNDPALVRVRALVLRETIAELEEVLAKWLGSAYGFGLFVFEE